MHFYCPNRLQHVYIICLYILQMFCPSIMLNITGQLQKPILGIHTANQYLAYVVITLQVKHEPMRPE